MAKKAGLPEAVLTPEEMALLVAKAKRIQEINAQVSVMDTELKELEQSIKENATTIRNNRMANGEYIGLIRVTDESISPIQVQFKISDGALPMDQEALIDAHYGSAREEFFKKAVDVMLTDINTTLVEAGARGENLNDHIDKDKNGHLKIKIKKGHEDDLAEYTSVIKVEALMPVEGFLASSNELKHTFNEKAMAFHNKYLEDVLVPSLYSGNKG